jgi:predicted permease
VPFRLPPRRWRRFLERAHRDEDAAREIESYLEIETDENLARGLPPEAARAAARRKLGNPTRVREEIYRMNTVGWLDTLWQDLRYAWRVLWRDKGVTVVAVLSLALGVGANTAIFQLLDFVRLRSLPVERPQELVEVRMPPGTSVTGSAEGRRPTMTFALVQELRRHQQAFSGLAVWGTRRFNTAPAGEVRFADGLFVSGDFFPTLGIRPTLGRLFTPADDQRGCAPAAVVSYAYWQGALGGSAAVLGQSLLLDGVSVPIIGVTPPAFFGVDVGRRYEVAVPICADQALSERTRLDRPNAWWLATLGRLRAGWTLDRASHHLQQLSKGLFEATLPPMYQAADAKSYLANRLVALDAAGGVSGLRREFARPLWLLLGIASLVLVVACANLANLLLARATVREREIAARLALGASRARLVRQLLVESLVLAALGATAGAALGSALSRTLAAVLAASYPAFFVDLSWNGRLFAFAAGVGSLACLLFGLAPALGATALSPATVLKAGGRGLGVSKARVSLRRVLVVSQVAVSLVLIVGGLLFVRTLYNLATTDPGFRHQDTLIAFISRLPQREPGEAAQAARRDLVARLAALPEVKHLVAADIVPLSQRGMWNENVRVEPRGTAREEWAISNFNRVGVGFLRATGLPLRAGRDFTERDTLGSTPVAIVSEEFVRRFVPDGRPIGRSVRVQPPVGEAETAYEIIGVAGDTKYGELRDEIEALVYLASSQERDPGTAAQVIAAPRGSLEALAPAIVRALREISPGAFVEFTVWDEAIRHSVVRERLMATLAAAFGLVAAVLASVGLYGLMSYNVTRRRQEIGLRVAIGASRRVVLRLVLEDALRLVVVGILVGTALAAVAARWSASLLYGLNPWDAATFLSAAVLLTIVGVGAALLPARRAARIAPAAALRDE